ncbi:2-deoxyribose-5-phosphate aldolase [Leptolyngbya valderiana BDU 20041]|nr:2-deoxyribose-5-phosphate aldolase [Leptolyngbya valderiana BDU 20041]
MLDQHLDIDIAPFIDHSLLNPCATQQYVGQWCEEADRFGFASVCIYPSYVRFARELLQGKRPKVCTVIGFPTGATTSTTKLYEAQEAVENGAEELDVVINLSWLKMGKTNEVHREIAEICEETNVTVKAIIETNLLSLEEKRIATEICIDSGVQFVKTCTGWNGGAKVEDVRLLKEFAKGQIGIKASGGIRSFEDAVELIEAGASRLGTSYSIQVLKSRGKEEEEEAETQPS